MISHSARQYRYRNCLFVLAHMRCGSTALSNILCSRPDVSGYGETHVRHDGRAALGQLALNQLRRGGRKPQADYLFDKVLHSRYDLEAPPEFFHARAVFMVRRPGDAIRSIVKLFRRVGKNEYRTQEAAAAYYVERLAALETLWRRFPPDRRIGLTHKALLRDPARQLAAISARLKLVPPLVNRYDSPPASRQGGGGDPLTSGRYARIEPRLHDPHADAPLEIPPELAAQCEDRYLRLCDLYSEDRGKA
ncbi:sulfotransferase family protein [Novosphingobium malaysiense]|uniref:sulfotransferase family protein n=1 Tax=Novosphingobium malaysiense TaxID=1348853 RepID=UPI000A735DEA|nr:sulfotransferase [Novosphingobium malaysiense]